MALIKFIKKSKEFKQFRKKSNKLVYRSCVILFFINDSLNNNEVAVGLIASSKIGNSVLRHKAKRRLRNICIDVFGASHLSRVSICVIARKPSSNLDYQIMKDSVINAINSINKTINEHNQ